MNKTKPQTQRRSIDLGVLVTVDEERIILDKAKALGMNKSNYVRFVCLSAKIETSIEVN